MAISGISFLAYKHPKGYNKLFPFLLGASVIVMAVMYSWDAAIHVTTLKLIALMTPEKAKEATETSKTLLITSGTFSAFSAGFMLYMSFLLWLPNIIEHRDDKKPE
jgi:zinc transporter ZupT